MDRQPSRKPKVPKIAMLASCQNTSSQSHFYQDPSPQQTQHAGPLAISRPANHMAAGKGSKNFDKGLLRAIMTCHSHFHPLVLGPPYPRCGRNSIIQGAPFWRTLPSPAKYCHLTHAVTRTSKGHSTTLANQLLQDGKKHDKTSKFHENGPVAALLLL